MPIHTDDLGAEVDLPNPPCRVVSLVPSLTEAVAITAPHLLVGATDYCTHPADLDVARVGGSKYPSVDRVLELKPDLVLANAEENRLADAEALRAAGIAVWTGFPHTVEEAIGSLRRMFTVLAVPTPHWLEDAERAWSVHEQPPVRRTAAIAVWRRPWVVLGPGTFAGDMLTRLGVSNVYDDADDRYPRPELTDILTRKPELLVLPDEPYAFHAEDGPECFPGIPSALVSGRHLTWYGPSLVEAPGLLLRQLGDDLGRRPGHA